MRPCAKEKRGARLHVGGQLVAVDVALQFVGRQHHDDIGPFGGIRHGHDLQALALGLLGGGRAGAQRDDDVLDAGIAHVQHMGMALGAVADDGDLLALDEVEVGIPVVINAHDRGGP